MSFVNADSYITVHTNSADREERGWRRKAKQKQLVLHSRFIYCHDSFRFRRKWQIKGQKQRANKKKSQRFWFTEESSVIQYSDIFYKIVAWHRHEKKSRNMKASSRRDYVLQPSNRKNLVLQYFFFKYWCIIVFILKKNMLLVRFCHFRSHTDSIFTKTLNKKCYDFIGQRDKDDTNQWPFTQNMSGNNFTVF